MREDRFFVNFQIKEGKFEIQDKEIWHQLRNVLRKRIGEEIILLDGTQKEGIAKIKKYSHNKVEIEIFKIQENQREPKIFVSLYCSILKKSNFDLVVQKATEIGVKEIIPIICKRTIKKGLNLERLRKISKEASEQSCRGILPQILAPISFTEAIKRAKNFDLKIIFDASGKEFSRTKGEKIEKVAIFIGPEGGWDKKELEMAKKENFEILNLGKLNLRAETAAIVASFLVVNLLS